MATEHARYIEFGQFIASRRMAREIKQEALAEAVGISGSYLSRIETGERRPRLQIAIRIADALGIPYEEISTRFPGDQDRPSVLPRKSGMSKLDDIEAIVEAIEPLSPPNRRRILKLSITLCRIAREDLEYVRRLTSHASP